MLQLIANGIATSLGGPAAGVATQVGGGLLSGVESKWFGGSDRDAQRQQRANAILGAANAGSIRAAQLIMVAPDNVSGNEQGYWRTAWGNLNSTMQAAAIAAGKTDWPTGQPFDMPNERSVIQGQLAAIGSSYVMSSLGGSAVATSVLAPLQSAIGSTIQNVGSQMVNQAAGAVNPAGQYVTLPTTKGTIILYAVLAAGVVYVLTHHHSS